MSDVQRELLETEVGRKYIIQGCEVIRSPGQGWMINGRFWPSLAEALRAVNKASNVKRRTV